MSPLHEIIDRSAARLSPVTVRQYKRIIDEWLAFAGEHPSGWTRLRAQAFYDGMLARGLTARSANTHFAALQHVAKWYADLNDRPQLNFAKIQTRPSTPIGDDDDTGSRVLEPNEALALINTCHSPGLIDRRDLTLLVVALETGMRRMSLRGMLFEKIKSQPGFSTIRVPIKGRGGHAFYSVPLSPLSLRVISAWSSTSGLSRGAILRGARRYMNQKTGKIAHEFHPVGLSDAAIYTIITERAERAGIGHVHPHTLRHTFITWRQAAGLTTQQIAAVTGHKLGPEFGAIDTYVNRYFANAPNAMNATPSWLVARVEELLRD
jgi:integrase/recombinase XerD